MQHAVSNILDNRKKTIKLKNSDNPNKIDIMYQVGQLLMEKVAVLSRKVKNMQESIMSYLTPAAGSRDVTW